MANLEVHGYPLSAAGSSLLLSYRSELSDLLAVLKIVTDSVQIDSTSDVIVHYEHIIALLDDLLTSRLKNQLPLIEPPSSTTESERQLETYYKTEVLERRPLAKGITDNLTSLRALRNRTSSLTELNELMVNSATGYTWWVLYNDEVLGQELDLREAASKYVTVETSNIEVIENQIVGRTESEADVTLAEKIAQLEIEFFWFGEIRREQVVTKRLKGKHFTNIQIPIIMSGRTKNIVQVWTVPTDVLNQLNLLGYGDSPIDELLQDRTVTSIDTDDPVTIANFLRPLQELLESESSFGKLIGENPRYSQPSAWVGQTLNVDLAEDRIDFQSLADEVSNIGSTFRGTVLPGNLQDDGLIAIALIEECFSTMNLTVTDLHDKIVPFLQESGYFLTYLLGSMGGNFPESLIGRVMGAEIQNGQKQDTFEELLRYLGGAVTRTKNVTDYDITGYIMPNGTRTIFKTEGAGSGEGTLMSPEGLPLVIKTVTLNWISGGGTLEMRDNGDGGFYLEGVAKASTGTISLSITITDIHAGDLLRFDDTGLIGGPVILEATLSTTPSAQQFTIVTTGTDPVGDTSQNLIDTFNNQGLAVTATRVENVVTLIANDKGSQNDAVTMFASNTTGFVLSNNTMVNGLTGRSGDGDPANSTIDYTTGTIVLNTGTQPPDTDTRIELSYTYDIIGEQGSEYFKSISKTTRYLIEVLGRIQQVIQFVDTTLSSVGTMNVNQSIAATITESVTMLVFIEGLVSKILSTLVGILKVTDTQLITLGETVQNTYNSGINSGISSLDLLRKQNTLIYGL
jgi:hypothetical protein